MFHHISKVCVCGCVFNKKTAALRLSEVTKVDDQTTHTRTHTDVIRQEAVLGPDNFRLSEVFSTCVFIKRF